MRCYAVFALLLACGQGKAPVTPVSAGDGGSGGDTAACEPATTKAKELYAQAAKTENVAENLVEEFVLANAHMVENDCLVSPESVSRCVLKATSSQEVETKCLRPLDDKGEVEALRFGAR